MGAPVWKSGRLSVQTGSELPSHPILRGKSETNMSKLEKQRVALQKLYQFVPAEDVAIRALIVRCFIFGVCYDKEADGIFKRVL